MYGRYRSITQKGGNEEKVEGATFNRQISAENTTDSVLDLHLSDDEEDNTMTFEAEMQDTAANDGIKSALVEISKFELECETDDEEADNVKPATSSGRSPVHHHAIKNSGPLDLRVDETQEIAESDDEGTAVERQASTESFHLDSDEVEIENQETEKPDRAGSTGPLDLHVTESESSMNVQDESLASKTDAESEKGARGDEDEDVGEVLEAGEETKKEDAEASDDDGMSANGEDTGGSEEDLEVSRGRVGATMTIDEINAVSDEEERLILRAEYREGHIGEIDSDGESDIEKKDLEAAAAIRRRPKPSEILEQERVIKFGSREVKKKSLGDFVAKMKDRLKAKAKTTAATGNRIRATVKTQSVDKTILLNLSDDSASEDDTPILIIKNDKLKKGKNGNNMSDLGHRSVPATITPTRKNLRTQLKLANKLNNLEGPIKTPVAPKTLEMEDKSDAGNSLAPAPPLPAGSVEMSMNFTESSMQLYVEDSLVSNTSQGDMDVDNEGEEGDAEVASEGEGEDALSDSASEKEATESEEDELSRRVVGDVGMSTREGFGLRVGSTAEIIRDDADGNGDGVSEPDDYIDLELTDNEDDPNEVDVANSDDEKFLEKKKVEIDQAKLDEMRLRMEAEREYDEENKIMDIVRGHARERISEKYESEDWAPGTYRGKGKTEEVNMDVSEWLKTTMAGELGGLGSDDIDKIKRAHTRSQKRKFVTMSRALSYEESEDLAAEVNTPPPQVRASRPSFSLAPIPNLSRTPSSSNSTSSDQKIRRTNSLIGLGINNNGTPLPADGTSTKSTGTAKAFFFQIEKVKSDAVTDSSAGPTNAKLSRTTSNPSRPSSTTAAATLKPAVFSKPKPIQNKTAPNSSKFLSILSCLT